MATRQFTNGMRYSVVGRYMVGSEVTAYHIVGEDGSQHKATKEQLILLADRGLMLNCRIQMYNGKPLLRGKGVNLGELPVFDEKSGKLKRMDTVPAVRPKGKESLKCVRPDIYRWKNNSRNICSTIHNIGITAE